MYRCIAFKEPAREVASLGHACRIRRRALGCLHLEAARVAVRPVTNELLPRHVLPDRPRQDPKVPAGPKLPCIHLAGVTRRPGDSGLYQAPRARPTGELPLHAFDLPGRAT